MIAPRDGSHAYAGFSPQGSGPLQTPRSSSAGGEDLLGETLRRVGSLNGLPVLHLMVVDEDDSVRDACIEIARKMGFAVVGANDIGSARGILKHQKIDLMLLDLKVPGDGGLSLLEDIKTLYPETSVVVMTAFSTVSSAVEAMRMGAGDYLTKPFALEELVAILDRAGELRHFDLETRRLREKLRNQKGAGHLIGHSPALEKIYRILSKVAHSSHPVLILGESGTGKELVARQIHFNGPNALKPFIPVDCGSLIPTMVEAELFGYVKGTFGEGYAQSREGLLAAEGGTVYLDEIGELTLELQAKLLRALQERVVRPLGGSSAVPILARVLAATSRDLMGMVEQGRFRKDLYFRLNVVNLRIPPLRERKEDLPLLAQHFLDRIQRESGVGHTLSDNALHILMAYDWPGNVRELEGALVRACALSSGPILNLGDLPTQLQDIRMQRQMLTSVDGIQGTPVEGRIVSIADLEREAILNTLRQLKGDKLMAARLLGIGKTTLYRKLKEYGFTQGMEGALDS